MATGLQNLAEDYLYAKLPVGLIDLDEQSILRALCGGIQDRIEDIRSYAKKYEVLFSSEGVRNTVVMATFETTYGKVVTRSIDLQDSTPSAEGDQLTQWAADQLGLDVSQITSCVFGEDLLRYVDAPVLQMLASTIGAVLYQTAAQSGSEALNQQKILNSYFPRLKIKGTAMSFDILGKLIGFDDVRMTPLWGRLSPRAPNDVGAAANDADFTETPDYHPQQVTGVAYDPHIFRDGPYYTWTGTVSADPESTGFYTQTVNGFQPWVKINVTGSVVHPAIGDSVSLAGGSPHTKAVATAGQGLQFQALGEGDDFNGLQVTFQDWNNGTDRLISITDRLSAVKYRTSYFDLALTLTDEHAIQQFGTTTAKPSTDLAENPALADGRVASSPFRPWRGGSGDTHGTYSDFTWISSGTVTPVSPRSQATTSLTQTQFKTDAIQAAGQEAVHVMEEVRAATRFPRRSSVGFLNRDDVSYAGQIAVSRLFDMTGTAAAEGIAESHPGPGYTISARVRNTTALQIDFPTVEGYTYYVVYSAVVFGPYNRISDYIAGDDAIATFYAVIGAGSGFFSVRRYPTVAGTPITSVGVALASVDISLPLQNEFDPYSNGTIIRFSDGVFFNGTYDLDQHWYRFEAVTNNQSITTAGLQVDAYWAPTTTDVVRSEPNPVPITQRFAAFGDNTNNNNTYQVGTMVASWEPDFLVMLGDHNYTNDPDDYANENRPFLPWINDGKVVVVPGNHDLDIQNGAAFYRFFGLTERYYSRRIGNVEIFAIDDGLNTAQTYMYPDWQGQLSEPARWLKEALSASQAPWKVVILHQDPYISVNDGHGSYVWLRWPFKDWGADVVMFGHVHAYEHMYVADAVRGNNGIHMLCIGFGGMSLKSFTGGGSYGSIYRFPQSPTTPVAGASRFTVTPTTFSWDTYTIDGTLRENYTLSKDANSSVYQQRPEDEPSVEKTYEVFDDVPWRRDLVGNGELLEITSRTPPVVEDFDTQAVSSTVAIKDQCGVDYTVYGIKSTVEPKRLAAEVNVTDKNYAPGQVPIAYKGEFSDLSSIPTKFTDRSVSVGEDLAVYTEPGFQLFHAGLVQGVLVADPVGFFGPHHRDGLKLWLPMNEHPDEGAVVLDRSVSGVEPALTGFTLRGSFANRVWDDAVGWNLHVSSGTVSGDGIREVGPEFSVSLWAKPDTDFGVNDSVLYGQGPLKIRANGSDNLYGITYQDLSGNEWTVGAGTMTPGEFNYIAISVDGPYLYHGLAGRSSSVTLTTGTLPVNFMPFSGTHTDFEIKCADRGFSISDVRVWNRSKTEAELEKVRDYQPKPTICTYWPTSINIAGDGDRYGLRVMDNGLIVPGAMPPAVRLNHLIRVSRYDDQARYHGENRFNEVGLGGGAPMPETWKLGQQFYSTTSTGTVVFCTNLGNVPVNNSWGTLGPGLYVDCPFSGSTAEGYADVPTATSSTPWPPTMEFNNPIREFAWIKGDDNRVYEVSLHSSPTAVELVGSLVVRERSDDDLVLNGALKIATAVDHSPHGSWDTVGTTWVTFDNGTFNPAQVLVETGGTYTASFSAASKGVAVLTDHAGEVKVYHPQSFRFVDQPTGACSTLADSGYEMTCNYGGYVYNRFTGSGSNTPPLYMYLTANTYEDTATPSTTANSVWGRWTDQHDTSLYGNTLSPRRAALDGNGIMEFENSSNLVPGHYRLTIESGAIGRVDEDFDGFSVILTVDTVQIEERLLVGRTGADFTGIDVFEFDYNGYNTETWLLTIQYVNALTDVNRGTQRHLAVNNYKLERVVTDMYKVSVAGAGQPTLEVVQTGSYTGTNPGGWLAILNSYGSVARVVHESNVFPANDTVSSSVPLSSMLTSNTAHRREDHYVSAGTSVLPDAAAVAMPTFGGIIVL